MCGSNLMILCPPCFLFGRSSQAVYHCCPLQEAPMPRDSATGKFILERVKREQVERQAARTAQALAHWESSAATVDLTEGSSSEPPAQRESLFAPVVPTQVTEEPWQRHVFGGGRTVVFSRGRSDCITIRQAPNGEGWFIDLGDQQGNCPE